MKIENMMNLKRYILILVVISFETLTAQSQPKFVSFQRGKLWHSYYVSQEVAPMTDWARNNIGLDWPGFSSDEIGENIGGSYSYLTAGGFFITALTDSGTVWGFSDFALFSSEVDWSGDDKKYWVTKHRKKWPNGENFWLATDPYDAEEIIETYWEINGSWYRPIDNQNLPIGIRRVARQWSGSQADENYIITEFTVINQLRRNTLEGVYLMFSYALSPTNRGWNLNFPNYTRGARNTTGYYDENDRLAVAWAGDFKGTTGVDESFDPFRHSVFDTQSGQISQFTEYMAPGFTGIRFLHISPDTNGVENRINGFTWSAGAADKDGGPFEDVLGLNNKYEAMADPSKLTRAFSDTSDARMGQSRLYANFSLGPFNIPRRDSVKIVVAEFVGGATYEESISDSADKNFVKSKGMAAVQYLNNRVEQTYLNNYVVPMPPPAPAFTIFADTNAGMISNIIKFSDSLESRPDPHQMIADVQGYNIYRSGLYPFGPWELLQTIKIKDPAFHDPANGIYTYRDDKVPLGFGFLYSITAFDSGHAVWAINGQPVPPLESSVFANRSKIPFKTTLKPHKNKLDEVVVVPNPFYRQSGFIEPGAEKDIQFVNISEKCTIRIYTLRGDLVKTINHDNPESGVVRWNQISDYGQFVKSGMYFYHISNPQGEIKKGKFAIIN